MNVLREAAKNLPGHWLKGGYADGKGNLCAVGHIMNAAGLSCDEMIIPPTGVEDTGYEKRRALSGIFYVANEVVREQTNGRFSYLAIFNDNPQTTEEDVVAMLEKAAVRLDEQI